MNYKIIVKDEQVKNNYPYFLQQILQKEAVKSVSDAICVRRHNRSSIRKHEKFVPNVVLMNQNLKEIDLNTQNILWSPFHN